MAGLNGRARCSGIRAAGPYAHATVHCVGKGTSIVAEGMHRGDFQNPRTYPRTNILGSGFRIDEDSRVEDVVRVKNILVLAERLQERRRINFLEQFGTGTAVTVFARYGAAIFLHEIGCTVQENSINLHPFFRLEVEGDSDVDASFAEMPEGNALKPQILQQVI